MPRYLSTSPFEQTLMGLSVGVDGVAVFPAPGRPDPVQGATVTLGEGDEIETPVELHFPGADRVDTPPPPAVTPPPTAPGANTPPTAPAVDTPPPPPGDDTHPTPEETT